MSKVQSPTKDKSKPSTLSSNQFPVGIGASAGGSDAFKKLLKAIPENSEIAFVLVQHLDPKHESMLPRLLQKVTKVLMEILYVIKGQAYPCPLQEINGDNTLKNNQYGYTS